MNMFTIASVFSKEIKNLHQKYSKLKETNRNKRAILYSLVVAPVLYIRVSLIQIFQCYVTHANFVKPVYITATWHTYHDVRFNSFHELEEDVIKECLSLSRYTEATQYNSVADPSGGATGTPPPPPSKYAVKVKRHRPSVVVDPRNAVHAL